MAAPITKIDLGIDDDDLAARVVAYGRNLAPCLDSLDGDARTEAVVVLRNVAATAAARLPGLRSRTVGDWSWTYLSDAEMGSMIAFDDRAVLRRLCGGAQADGAKPLGCFPGVPRHLSRLWPR